MINVSKNKILNLTYNKICANIYLAIANNLEVLQTKKTRCRIPSLLPYLSSSFIILRIVLRIQKYNNKAIVFLKFFKLAPFPNSRKAKLIYTIYSFLSNRVFYDIFYVHDFLF